MRGQGHFTSFVYLVSEVSNTGDFLAEKISRRGAAVGIMSDLWRSLWRCHHMSQCTKLRVYNAAVLSGLLYGVETWPLVKYLACHVCGFESRALGTIQWVHWSDLVSNEELCRRTEHLSHRHSVSCSLVRSHSDDHPYQSFTSSSRHLQTGNNIAVDHAAAGKTSSVRTTNRLIYHWSLMLYFILIV